MAQETPFHVAIIPDGNRRWARANALEVWKGHERGARRIRELTTVSFDAGVTHLSLWGSSLDNFTKRPMMERTALLRVYEEAIMQMMKEEEHTVMRARVLAIGRWRDIFPIALQEKIMALQEVTAHYTGRTIILLLAYNGDDEMLDAIEHMVDQRVSATPETLKAHLWTRDLPPVDLMIRTGGEPHLSAGFMMWDMANAHLHFTDTLFPDFTPVELRGALDTFTARTRRLGA